MVNLDSITNENNKKHNPYRILIVGGSGSGKTNTLINLINEQNDIDKMHLYAKDLSEPKYEDLIKKRNDAGIKHVNNSIAFIKCSNTTGGVYENISNYNPSRRRRILNAFDDMLQTL